jgi:hypothetical protein
MILSLEDAMANSERIGTTNKLSPLVSNGQIHTPFVSPFGIFNRIASNNTFYQSYHDLITLGYTEPSSSNQLSSLD